MLKLRRLLVVSSCGHKDSVVLIGAGAIIVGWLYGVGGN